MLPTNISNGKVKVFSSPGDLHEETRKTIGNFNHCVQETLKKCKQQGSRKSYVNLDQSSHVQIPNMDIEKHHESDDVGQVVMTEGKCHASTRKRSRSEINQARTSKNNAEASSEFLRSQQLESRIPRPTRVDKSTKSNNANTRKYGQNTEVKCIETKPNQDIAVASKFSECDQTLQPPEPDSGERNQDSTIDDSPKNQLLPYEQAKKLSRIPWIICSELDNTPCDLLHKGDYNLRRKCRIQQQRIATLSSGLFKLKKSQRELRNLEVRVNLTDESLNSIEQNEDQRKYATFVDAGVARENINTSHLNPKVATKSINTSHSNQKYSAEVWRAKYLQSEDISKRLRNENVNLYNQLMTTEGHLRPLTLDTIMPDFIKIRAQFAKPIITAFKSKLFDVKEGCYYLSETIENLFFYIFQNTHNRVIQILMLMGHLIEPNSESYQRNYVYVKSMMLANLSKTPLATNVLTQLETILTSKTLFNGIYKCCKALIPHLVKLSLLEPRIELQFNIDAGREDAFLLRDFIKLSPPLLLFPRMTQVSIQEPHNIPPFFVS